MVYFYYGPDLWCFFWVCLILTDERFCKRTSVRKPLSIRLTISIIFLTTVILSSYLIVPPLLGVDISLMDFIFDKGSFPIYFYIFTVDLFMVALWQVNLMLGENNLRKILQGKFYEPHEENRIFMFLDLKDSTQHAERLGI